VDKIMLLQTQQGKANILASSITGFITGNKRGTGYVLINGVGTPITDCFDESEREWKEWFESNRSIVGKGERPFEFRDHEDSLTTVRLGDVRFIRRHNQHAVVFLVDHISIRSCEDYYDLSGRFNDALK
jgi:hypothetical protein